MTTAPQHEVDAALVRLAREDSRRVLALLARRFGDLDLADESVQEGLIEAAWVWRTRGIPTNPAGWLLAVSRRKAIDRMRRTASAHRRTMSAAPELLAGGTSDDSDRSLMIADDTDEPVGDEQLRLMLLCCHPALDSESQVALTLRLVGGLTTPEIASAFLIPEATLAQRIVRAKRKIRDARVPLSHQDRTRWDLAAIGEANTVLRRALARMAPGPYQMQALIAAHHANARTAADTDWPKIAELYGQLTQMSDSPVIRLNHAAAISMADGPHAGLALLAEVHGLDDYHLFHATRGELLLEAGQPEAAAAAFETARSQTASTAERRHLDRRLAAARQV